MITLKIDGQVRVEGASSKEEATKAVMEVAGSTEISAMSKKGPDESPVFLVILKSEVFTLEEGAAEETEEGPEVPPEATEVES